MKLVITIDDDIYDDYLKQGATVPKYSTAMNSLYEALWNGVPLPKHHGRLIDENDLKTLFELEDRLWWGNAVDEFTDLPTIIEADRGEE